MLDSCRVGTASWSDAEMVRDWYPKGVSARDRLPYLRLHGRDAHAFLTGKSVAERFNYHYSEAELIEVSKRVKTLTATAKAAHIIFNNCRSNFAPTNAIRFRELLGQVAPTQPTYETPDLFEWHSR